MDNCPDGSARAFVAAQDGFEYLHEARGGVVNARNTGVAAATGEYILFLDDDEVPAPGWLDAFAAQAQAGVDMAFGRILPRYDGVPDPALEPLLHKLFSRDYDLAPGADIAAHYAELGTGNALFHKARCLGGTPPFDMRFNTRGGEDIYLIKSLMDQGMGLAWCPGGQVEELVPATRMTANYLKDRRYNQGQQRCLFLAGNPSLTKKAQVLPWMGVGAVQALAAAARRSWARARGDEAAVLHDIQVQGGLGKLFWWSEPSRHLYGTAPEETPS